MKRIAALFFIVLFVAFSSLFAQLAPSASGVPVISSLSPTSAAVDAPVTISGSGFGDKQGKSTVTFNGTVASVTSWSDDSIDVPVPEGATTGNVVVSVKGTPTNGVLFTVLPAPVITALSPALGAVGASVTITGSNFGSAQGTSTLKFHGSVASVTSWSATSIVAVVPPGATTGRVVVQAAGVDSNGVSFTVVPPPSITSLSPSSGAAGTSITITGSDFGATQGPSTVNFNGTLATPSTWSATSIVAPAPNGATSGPVVVHASGVDSNGVNFTVAPSISSLSPASGPVGSSVTISGLNFGATQGASTVTFNGTSATPTSWSGTQVVTTVPAGTTTGDVVVSVSGAPSNGFPFTVITTGTLSGTITRASDGVSLSGALVEALQFGVTIKSATNAADGTYSIADLAAGTYDVRISASGYQIQLVTGVSLAANTTITVDSSLAGPTIASIAPASAAIGTSVTISGSNFGATQGTVTFNGTPGTPSSWSDTSIVVPVPSGATSGPVLVTAQSVTSNTVTFTVRVPPAISGLSPTSAQPGDPMIISGSNFGANQGTSVVSFNGVAATIGAWSDTSITAYVPATATTGNVIVTVDGLVSNGVNFTVLPPPPPVISALSPVSGGIATAVTISGSNFGASQGTSTVSFGGLAPSVASWGPSSITVSVPAGLSPGVVAVQVTVGGVASNSANFTVTDPLLLTPNEMTLVAGQTQRLQILNADGSVAGIAAYTVDDDSIAEVLDDGNGGFMLSAKASGETMLRAFLGDRSGEASVKVIFLAAGQSLPAGTVAWAAPPLGDKYVNKIVQSRKVDDATPDFFVEELPNSGGIRGVVRAFTADGQQKWVWPNDGRAISTAAADNTGGVLVFNAFTTDTQTYLSSVGKDGLELWRTATPSASIFKYAVHPDGTVFVLQVPAGLNPAPAQVVALDAATGQPAFSVTLPASGTTTTGIRGGYVNPKTGQSYTICDPLNSTTSNQVSRVGGLVIDGAGLLWVPVVANVTNRSVACTPQVDSDGNAVPWDGSGTSYSYTSTVHLVSVASGGTASTTQINSTGGSGTNWNAAMPKFSVRNAIIPDGTGGVLFAGVTPGAAEVIFGSSGVQYSSPVGPVDQMLLGENDTIFAAGAFSGVTALNLQTASPIWQRPDAVDLTAALEGDSVLVDSGTLEKIDSTGTISDLAAGAPAYQWNYFGNNWWAAAKDTGGMELVKGAAKKIVESLFPMAGGNAQRQQTRSFTLGLFWCGTGPAGQGPCSQVGGSDVQFAYVANPQQSNLNMLQDFSVAHPDWVGIMNNEALKALWGAFARYSIDVRLASLVGPPHELRSEFTHTAYVVGDWPGDAGQVGYSPDLNTSRVYYLKIMGNAQSALSQYEPTLVPFQPVYPPTDAQGESDFRRLAAAIGRAIGNIAAHEFGHQLAVPKPDCGNDPTNPAGLILCDDNYDYVHNFFSGSGTPYTPPGGTGGQFKYVDVPGVPPIRWSRSACEKLKLLGGNTGITCP